MKIKKRPIKIFRVHMPAEECQMCFFAGCCLWLFGLCIWWFVKVYSSWNRCPLATNTMDSCIIYQKAEKECILFCI